MAKIHSLHPDSIRELSQHMHQLERMVLNTVRQMRGQHPRMLAAAATNNIFRFTTTEDMGATTADQASATIRTLKNVQVATDKIVRDVDQLFGRSLSGAKGIAARFANEYHIIECEVESQRYYGLQVGALLTTDSTNGIDNLEAMDGGQKTTAGSITANNTFSWEADDNAPTIIEWNDETSDWDMVQVKCPA